MKLTVTLKVAQISVVSGRVGQVSVSLVSRVVVLEGAYTAVRQVSALVNMEAQLRCKRKQTSTLFYANELMKKLIASEFTPHDYEQFHKKTSNRSYMRPS